MWHLNGEPAPRDPASGWLLVDGVQYPHDWPRDDLEAMGLVWVDPPEPEKPKPTQAQCLKSLADRRWWKTQTFTFDGVETQADPAIAVVNATLALRQRRGIPAEAEQVWKLTNADFRLWSEAQIEAFGFAIADHIQGCFDREAELSAMIVAAEDPSSVDTSTGWPV